MTENKNLIITEAAQNRVKAHRKEAGNEALNLRITVQGGGCAGFEYIFDWDDKIKESEDLLFENSVITDDISIDMMAGATVDYIENINGSDFIIQNPNATSGCGCGTSFSI